MRTDEQLQIFYGKNTHRFANNPEEEAFAKKWVESHRYGDTLGWLLGDGTRITEPTDEQAQLVGTIIQWLGSPVGQGFLRELGYEKRSPF